MKIKYPGLNKMQFARNDRLSQSIYLLAEYAAIASGFLIFIRLAGTLKPADFAGWEWLQVWLGLCLLLPRNGLDLVAIRTAYRHQAHLREWTAIVLLTRILLSLPAMALMLSAGKLMNIDQRTIEILMITIPVSAALPDIAARIQGRFKKHAFILSIKNIAFLIMLIFGNFTNLNRVAEFYLNCEVIVSLMWWIDAWQFNALPGGRWLTLLRRGGRAILARSLNQSVGRWLRVFSFSADALFIGLVAPGAWSIMAPGRKLMMSVVMPLGNWLGSTGHKMTLWPRVRIQYYDHLIRRVCMTITVFILILASFMPDFKILNSDSDIFLIVFARAGVVAYGFWLMAAQAAMRQDSQAWLIPVFFTTGSLLIAIAATFSIEMQYALKLLLPLEWAAIRLIGEYIFRKPDLKDNADYSIKLLSTALTSRIKRNQNEKAA